MLDPADWSARFITISTDTSVLATPAGIYPDENVEDTFHIIKLKEGPCAWGLEPEVIAKHAHLPWCYCDGPCTCRPHRTPALPSPPLRSLHTPAVLPPPLAPLR